MVYLYKIFPTKLTIDSHDREKVLSQLW